MAKIGKQDKKLMHRRQQVAEMYLGGMYQTEISEQLNVNQSTISRDLQWLYEHWRESTLVDMDKVKAQELARIDRLERSYWLAWEQSKKAEIKTVARGRHGAGHPESAIKTTRTQYGDPRFLNGIQWCIEQRLKIFGLYAPTKTSHGVTGAGGAKVSGLLISFDDDTIEHDDQAPETNADLSKE